LSVPQHTLPTDLVAFSAATRVAGAVVAVAYLIGYVDGPVVVVIGGLGLMTLGRGLLTDRADEALAGGALAVMAAALGVGALRWGTLSLSEMRSAQAVLGPTVMVGPDQAALAACLGSAAFVIALSAWLASVGRRNVWGYIGAALEASVAGLAVVTVFWGPVPLSALDLLEWTGLVAAVATVAVAFSELERRAGAANLVRWIAVGLAAVAVAAATSLVGTAV
jgi:hypothetical protein